MNGCWPIGNDGTDADRRRVAFTVAISTGGGGGGGSGGGSGVAGGGVYRGTGVTTKAGVRGDDELRTRLGGRLPPRFMGLKR